MIKKQSFFYISFVLLVNICVHAQTAQEIFLQANNYYDEKEFSQAVATYQKLETKDAGILYNLGNSYYMLEDYTNALVSWRQAECQAPSKMLASIEHNIAAAEEKLGITNTKSYKEIFWRVLASLSMMWLQILFLFSWFALFLFIKKYNCGTKYIRFSLTLLLVLMVSCGTILIMKYHSLAQHKGIVMKSNVSLFAGPDEQYHVLSPVDQASCVNIIEQRNAWYKIKYKNSTGWVTKDSLMVL